MTGQLVGRLVLRSESMHSEEIEGVIFIGYFGFGGRLHENPQRNRVEAIRVPSPRDNCRARNREHRMINF
jgi:hypothetical protein